MNSRGNEKEKGQTLKNRRREGGMGSHGSKPMPSKKETLSFPRQTMGPGKWGGQPGLRAARPYP